MAQAQDDVLFYTNFMDGNNEKMSWMNRPNTVETLKETSERPGGMHIYMDEKTDFWQKTYYNFGSKDDGHVFFLDSTKSRVVMETSFDLTSVNKFDQAGLMIRYNDEHWIKTGLEYVDGTCYLSCVVTNGFSDWSAQPWTSNQLAIRLYQLKNDIVVESKLPSEDKWNFFRICHLDVPVEASLKLGIMACAPAASGGSVLFHKFSLSNTTGHHHTG